MSPSLVDPVLTSIAREEIPDCYVRTHTHEDGTRELSLHAGNYNAEREVTPSRLRSADPLRIALDRLIDGYWAARRPGNGARTICNCWMDGCGWPGAPTSCQHDAGCPERRSGAAVEGCCGKRHA